MPCIGSEVRLRAFASSRKICRYCSRGLVRWVRTVAATVEIVVLAVDNVYRASECGCGGVGGAQCKHLAEGVGLFVRDLDGEYCAEINKDTREYVQKRESLLFGS